MPSAADIPALNELVVGLDDETQEIIDRLTRGTIQLDIVSIVGMPGLGKTTLAKKVCSDPSIIHYFHVRSWCIVSQIYNKKDLLLEILGDNVSNPHDKTEADLAEKLYKHLKGKKYLIILDDVWDNAIWNSLGSSFPNDSNGSRILLTSRHYNVASQIKQHSEPHCLRPLTDDESWELLQKKICFEEDSPQELLACAKEIAQDCKGLPLMILIVAGLLSNVEPDTWGEIAESLRKGTPPTTDQCKETLELSYRYLPDYLKPCFLYFGAFREDQQLRVRELLWLWIAEGFVEKKTEREGCLEDIAEGYMMELMQRSLVMVAEKGSRGRVKSCIIHDLLLEFCKTKSNEEHFVHCLHGYELDTSIKPNIFYRLRVDSRKQQDFAQSWSPCSHLRTLFFDADFGKSYGQYWYDIFWNFCHSKLLRVFDLRAIHLDHFFPVILLLVHLKFLALAVKDQQLTIPSSIDNLSDLETLIVEMQYPQSVLLPDTVYNMKKLRHLCTTTWESSWMFGEVNPQYHSSLENLQTLSTVTLSYGHTTKEAIRKFANLRRLKLKLTGTQACTENNHILELVFMSKLESLSICFIKIYDLHFQFPVNLKKLVLEHTWLPWSEMLAIEELPNLEILMLLDDSFRGELWEMDEGKFPKLRILELRGLDFKRWTGSDDEFPRLEKLVLVSCWKLSEIPSSLAYNSTLEMIYVSSCISLTSSIEQIREEAMNMGNEYLKIHMAQSS